MMLKLIKSISTPFHIIWISNLVWFEVLLVYWYIYTCPQHVIAESQITCVVVADPQLTDQYSYNQRGLLLAITEFYCDLYMLRNYKAIMLAFKPEVVLFVGDLMDGGREWVRESER